MSPSELIAVLSKEQAAFVEAHAVFQAAKTRLLETFEKCKADLHELIPERYGDCPARDAFVDLSARVNELGSAGHLPRVVNAISRILVEIAADKRPDEH